MLNNIDVELQNEILDFIEKQESKKNQPLGRALVASILRKLVDGDCRITGCASDNKTGKLWVEYSFYVEELK